MSELEKVLLSGAEQIGIKLTTSKANKLLDYLQLIIKWNQVHNLSAICNTLDGINKHLLDSLSISFYVTDAPLLDIGSGAGLPGIVLAIIKPKLQVSVLDSRGKKCYFMQFVKTKLRLGNLTVIHSRVETFNPLNCFAQISSRAFTSVETTLKLSNHLLCSDGHYLLMRGECFALEKIDGLLVVSHKIRLPYTKKMRFLVELRKI